MYNQFFQYYLKKHVLIFKTASEIERIASGNMYKEQAWVEKLLKRVRNEADVQSQVRNSPMNDGFILRRLRINSLHCHKYK